MEQGREYPDWKELDLVTDRKSVCWTVVRRCCIVGNKTQPKRCQTTSPSEWVMVTSNCLQVMSNLFPEHFLSQIDLR